VVYMLSYFGAAKANLREVLVTAGDDTLEVMLSNVAPVSAVRAARVSEGCLQGGLRTHLANRAGLPAIRPGSGLPSGSGPCRFENPEFKTRSGPLWESIRRATLRDLD
jgi:hypothetical protein